MRSQPQKRNESCGTSIQGMKTGPSSSAIDNAICAHMTCACPRAKTTSRPSARSIINPSVTTRSKAASNTPGRSVATFQPKENRPPTKRPRAKSACQAPIARAICSAIAVPASATIIPWSHSPMPVIRSGTLRPAPGSGAV